MMPRDKENQKRLAREWYERNKELAKERARAWSEANPEKRKEIRAKWREENRDQHNETNRNWNAENKDKKAAYAAKRRAAQLQRTPPWLTEDQMWMIEQAYELAALRTKMFGFEWHVDHIVPLQGKRVSGLHVPWNLQVIPGVDNMKKSNKWAEQS
jgi:hypothetical protein